jgi:hypothetical protein
MMAYRVANSICVWLYVSLIVYYPIEGAAANLRINNLIVLLFCERFHSLQ